MPEGRKIAIAVVELVIFLVFLNFAMVAYDYLRKEQALSFPIAFVPRTLPNEVYLAINIVTVALWVLTIVRNILQYGF